ncbi:phenylacetaldoxime dehydratase family protein [Rhodococcus sp. T2V]|uniref:phenylacetaldoxime dehydratase family protein n=1 Tax=Rhodococcus sp. T2V TaxID=3034164 RepID=UPI0023E207A5|nr:phenylacetaldoxime dehydratase family protein [Rhodococcus sp. T2V]MDF3306786.1 phenylacetaldoxime dehydratase family protein [Rhodococcus sp. T2V]
MPRDIRITANAPRFDRWSITYPEGVTEVLFAQFGVQAASLEQANAAADDMLGLFDHDPRPTVLDRGQFIDTFGFANATLRAYWFCPDDYHRWAAQESVEMFWASRLSTGPVGYYRETAVISRDHSTAEYINCHNRTGFLTVLDRVPAGAAV